MKQKAVAEKITRESTIGEVVQKYPSVVETLLSFGVHCVGCQVAYYETIEQGLTAHGFGSEDIDKAVKKLNEAIVENPKDAKDIMVTDKAAKKIKELINEKGDDIKGLRVGVVPGGCAGFSYSLDFEKTKHKDDKVIKEKGITLFIDKESFEFLKGSQVDYVEALQGAGFKISNPNAKSSCGCGQSFS